MTTKTLKNTLTSIGFIFIVKILGASALFLSYLIIARLWGPEQLGAYQLIVLLMFLTALVGRCGTDVYLTKMLPRYVGDHDVQSRIIWNVVFRVTVLLFFVSLLFFIKTETIDEILFKSSNTSLHLKFLPFLIITFGLISVLSEIYRGLGDIKSYSIFKDGAINLSTLIALIGLYLFFGPSFNPITALFCALGLTFFLQLISLKNFLQKKNIVLKLISNQQFNLNVFRDSYPMFLTSGAFFIMGSIDSFMIAYYLDESAVGVYTACTKLSFPIILIVSSVNSYFAPKISLAYKHKKYTNIEDKYLESVKIIMCFSMAISLILFSFPNWFLSLFGEGFDQATLTLYLVNLAFLVNALFGPVGQFMNMIDKERLVYLVILIALLINILSNAFLIPMHGITGAALATFLSTAFWNIFLYISFRKTLRMLHASALITESKKG